MFANTNASRSFSSLTIDELRWLSANKAFGDDGESDHGVSPTDPVKPPSPKNARYVDRRRRSILLDDFLGTSNTLSRTVDSSKTRFGLHPRSETPPPSSEEGLPATPPRSGLHSSTPSIQEDEVFATPPRPTEWLYRRPRSPSSLSRSPSSLSQSPSSISRSTSSSRSVTPTPSRLRCPTGSRPHTPTAVTEMNISPFYSTVIAPVKRSPSIRTGSPASRQGRPSTPSRSSPNLLEFRGATRAKTLPIRPQLLPIHRERSGSASSISTTSSTSSLPRTPPSPSLYSPHSFAQPLPLPLPSEQQPSTRATTPTRSILAQSPKRSASISTKHSSRSASKSVKFDCNNEFVPAPIPMAIIPRYTGDHKETFGDGKVRGEEWNSRLVESFDDDERDHEHDVFGGGPVSVAAHVTTASGASSAPPKSPGALKRFLTLRSTRSKTKARPEISGPYALSPTGAGSAGTSPVAAAHRPLDHDETQSLFGVSSSPFRYRSAPASASTASFGNLNAKGTHNKAPSLMSTCTTDDGDSRYPTANKFHSHPTRRLRSATTPSSSSSTSHSHGHGHKAASIADMGSIGESRPAPTLHTLPSMESFRSARSCNPSRLRGWLGRIGIGMAA
uniref:Uncharacterized protein n=1 Tax=Mycena chlorophos TaxID=658473 RepID=A0ABQ0M2L8_MYCCL|nr:predicted protein [Mycena chlorophos]